MLTATSAGTAPLYFQADGRYETPEAIICIDIDCHGRGSYQGAVPCGIAQRAESPADLLVEVHQRPGDPRLPAGRQAGTNARGLDVVLLEFERWLKYQSSVQRWDIEGIEVKGRPPIFDWGDEKHELLGLKMGAWRSCRSRPWTARWS